MAGRSPGLVPGGCAVAMTTGAWPGGPMLQSDSWHFESAREPRVTHLPSATRLERQIRAWSGLIVAVFVVAHLLNHALATFSLGDAEKMRSALATVWRSVPGSVLLYGSLMVHFLTSLLALVRRRTLRMPAWEGAQLLLGLAVFPLLAGHVIGTRGVVEFFDGDPGYQVVSLALWSNAEYTVIQIALSLIVWLHFAIGLHFWLRLYTWYPRWQSVVHAFLVLVPVLAMLGFARAGDQVEVLAADEMRVMALLGTLGGPIDQVVAFTRQTTDASRFWYGVLIVVLLAGRWLVLLYARRRGSFELVLPDSRRVRGVRGLTMLEALRAAGIPHAAVCGGRGRCTTCRVRVGDPSASVPTPSAMERAALERIGAPPNVRLACQARPQGRVDITPLIRADAGSAEARKPGGVSGHERIITTMFLDLRGSTALGERRLPYDVLFILNQFFAEMALGLNESNGHYAQFAGDGLMALYGLERGERQGARDALRGAERMLQRLAALNERLAEELDAPLRIGIGIHTGEAIVGTMGPPTSPNYSAIGDNINIAARLEAKTKELSCVVVVSAATLTTAGFDPANYPSRLVDVRGREGDIQVCLFERAEEVPNQPDAEPAAA